MRRVLTALFCCLSLLPSAAIAQEATPTPDGSETRPLPMKQVGRVGQWSVSVTNVWDDPRAITPNDDFFLYWLDQNPVPDGKAFLTVRLTIANAGDRAGYPMMDLSFEFVSETGYTYDGRMNCGDVPGVISISTQLDVDDAVEGTVCRVVDTDRLGRLRLRVSQFGTSGIWFSIDSPDGTPVPD